MPEKLKVVHTSAVHLGKRFPQLDAEAAEVRFRDVFAAFEQVVDYVIKNKAGIFLVAGDLFDKLRPTHETIEFALSKFGEIHAKSPDTRIVVCPGEEEIVARVDGGLDCVLSIFRHMDYVHIIGVDGVDSIQLTWQDKAVRVSSCPFDHLIEEDFRFREVPGCHNEFGIMLLHCLSRRRGAAESLEILEEKVIAPLFQRGYRLFALGHPVKRKNMSTADFAAVFPGSLERFDLEQDREKKTFTIYEIAEKGEPPEVSTSKIKLRPLEFVSVNCTPDENDLAGMIEGMTKKGRADSILYIVLDGQAKFSVYNKFRGGDLLKSLKERFAVVHVDTRLTLIDDNEDYRFRALQVGTPEEEFRAFMEREITQAQPGSQEQNLLAELLEMGLREIGEEL